MSKNTGIPDAWDDDYEKVAASIPQQAASTTESRADRKAQHAEANKQLWESAENPQTFHYLEARETVPLKSDFKPQLQLLSRKPKTVSSTTAGGGLEQEDDSEEERRKAKELGFAEKQDKARREREEKQKRYAEVRERLFGTPSPAAEPGRPSSPAGSSSRHIRGNRRGGGDLSGRASQSGSSADHSPARAPPQSKELFDPISAAKPRSVRLARREAQTTSDANRPTRQPKGPDGSGRGGAGFTLRGNLSNAT